MPDPSQTADSVGHPRRYRIRRWLAESRPMHRGFLLGVALMWGGALTQRWLVVALPLVVVGAVLMTLYRGRRLSPNDSYGAGR